MPAPALERGQHSHQGEYVGSGCQEGHHCMGEWEGSLRTWMVCVIFVLV